MDGTAARGRVEWSRVCQGLTSSVGSLEDEIADTDDVVVIGEPGDGLVDVK